MTTFSELGLDARLMQSLEAEGYTTPTPIQAQAIPAVMAGSDLLGIAQTGTGKTAAFALPILHRLALDKKPAPRRGCRVLVLSPTRELASQIAESFRTYGRHMGVTVATVYGGVGHRPQIQAVSRGVDVLVATPGRLLDHVGERNMVLTGTEIFVLDEADQMLDLGFLQPIRKVVAQMTGKRQNLFFSATMPGEIGKLAGELLVNPVKVSVAPQATTAERVAQRVIHVERHKKRAVLVELLANADLTRALVFTRTKRGADKVAEHLEAASISVAAIHGNKSQGQREKALDLFRKSKIRVLVATDIAARGIDIDQVSHVINFELPDVPEAYVHRIGRTARAGAEGIAISLCDPDERGQLRDIERLTRQSLPHENRISGDAVPLDATGAPRGRPEGARTSVSFKPRGDRKPHRGQGDRGQGERGERGSRSDFAPRGDRADRASRDARAPRRDHGAAPRPSSNDAPFGEVPRAPYRPERTAEYDIREGGAGRGPRGDRADRGDRGPRKDFAPRGDRSSAPRGDRKPGGDGFKPRGDRSAAPRGDRKPGGDGFKPRGDFAARGDRPDRGSDRKSHSDGVKARGDFTPRVDRSNDRKPNADGFKPRGERKPGGAESKPRKDFAPRRDAGENRGHNGGKPGGYQGLKRKTGDKPVWSNRP
ncbi:MAG: DEAD/DEAH box helicase [Hyphomicrobiaceae bacterium]|nr:DEAD/DEAH box helicase [Hyphomicrobiaceae bacterium]